MEFHSLYQVIAEQGYSWSWHLYEAGGTKVGPADVVFDCGAAEGLFAFLVRKRAAQVVCFEPLLEFRACLRRTFVASGNVELVPAALSDRPGTGYLVRDGFMSGLSDRPTSDEVPVETIDGFCTRTGIVPTYIKADVEGDELALLRGGAQTIRKYRPKIAIATYHQDGDYQSLRGFLHSLHPGYHFMGKGIEVPFGQPVLLHAW
jgi:FkbM family methyltransferase